MYDAYHANRTAKFLMDLSIPGIFDSLCHAILHSIITLLTHYFPKLNVKLFVIKEQRSVLIKLA